MKMSSTRKYQGYLIGAQSGLSKAQVANLSHHLNSRHLKSRQSGPKSILGGRSQPLCFDLDECGPVMMKKYYRGGIIRHFIRETHFRWGLTRPQAEFQILNRLRTLGISVPKPVAFITKGTWFYQGWLVTQQIKNAHSLIKIASGDRKKAETAVQQMIDQVSLLVKHQIHHTDLHPGNVLVDDQGKVYIVDFDKARSGIRNAEKLRTYYKRRWQRAIKKYRLPKWLDHAMVHNL